MSINNTQNPHLKLIKNYEKIIINNILMLKKKLNKNKLKLLDIGGGKGWGKILYERDDIDYYSLDLKSSRTENNINFIKGDITDEKLQLKNKFDIIFTKDTFEHILNPWDTTNNIINNLCENGLFIFLAPFSWRYHASPYDTFRYTHTGAQYLFERYGKMKKILSGYINFGNINGFWKNKKDHTMDGKPFLKCLEVIYIGEKINNWKFDKKYLDTDNSWNHSV